MLLNKILIFETIFLYKRFNLTFSFLLESIYSGRFILHKIVVRSFRLIFVLLEFFQLLQTLLIYIELIKIVLLVLFLLLMTLLYHRLRFFLPILWSLFYLRLLVFLFVQCLTDLSIIQMHNIAFGSASFGLILVSDGLFDLLASLSICLLSWFAIIFSFKEFIFLFHKWI